MLLSVLAVEGILSTFGSAIIGSLATVVAGAIVGAVVLVVKKPFAIYKEHKIQKENQAKDDFKNDIIEAISTKEKAENANLQSQIDEVKTAVKIITDGILSIQGRDFKKHCRELINKPIVTENEYLEICKDYDAYKALDGNGEGDILFADLKEKHKAQLEAQAHVAAQQASQNN